MFLFSRPFLFAEEGGRRIVSWRVWLFVWIVPALFALSALVMAGEVAWRLSQMERGEGEVSFVYSWPGETLFNRGTMNYAPVFIYRVDGEEIRASTWMADPDWDFPLGSQHEILYDPRGALDVMLPGPKNWAVPRVVAMIALGFAIPALLLHGLVRRWQRGVRD